MSLDVKGNNEYAIKSSANLARLNMKIMQCVLDVVRLYQTLTTCLHCICMHVDPRTDLFMCTQLSIQTCILTHNELALIFEAITCLMQHFLT